MPVISVSMTKENGGLSKAQKQKLISGLTSAFVDVVGRGEKTCVVVINEVECQNYGIGGVSIEELRKSQNSLRHCRNSVIASEAKQSLGILDFLGVRGCLFFGNSRIPRINSRIPKSRIPKQILEFPSEFQNSQALCHPRLDPSPSRRYFSAQQATRLILFFLLKIFWF